MDEAKIKLFFNDIYNIKNKYEEESRKLGANINILQATGKDHDEVVICRLLAFLLNPNEKHGQGTKFLNLFLQNIGEDQITESENFSVKTEFPTDKGRRIDIVLESNKRFLPFEVKIYATDQKEQCIHYYEFSKEKCKGEKVFYLTPDGHSPDESSLGELVIGKTLILISFRKHILSWIEQCEKEKDLSPVLKEYIRELKLTIRKFCGLEENMEMTNEILNKIFESDENFEISKTIFSAGLEIQPDNLWKDFCKESENEKKIPCDWCKFDSESQNTFTISILDDEVEIDFTEIFNRIFIATDGNQKLAEIIQTALKENKNYSSLIFEGINSNGLSIRGTKEFFLGNENANPFDLYRIFTKKECKDELVRKMQDFITAVYNACE